MSVHYSIQHLDTHQEIYMKSYLASKRSCAMSLMLITPHATMFIRIIPSIYKLRDRDKTLDMKCELLPKVLEDVHKKEEGKKRLILW